MLMPEVDARRALAGRRVRFSVLAPFGRWLGCGTLRVLRASRIRATKRRRGTRSAATNRTSDWNCRRDDDRSMRKPQLPSNSIRARSRATSRSSWTATAAGPSAAAAGDRRPSPRHRRAAAKSRAPPASSASKSLTVYGFSTENWNRDAREISLLFDLCVYFARNELAELQPQQRSRSRHRRLGVAAAASARRAGATCRRRPRATPACC